MPGETPASGGERSATRRVAVGRHVLEIGDPAGTALTDVPTESEESVPQALSRALARERRRRRKVPPEAIEAAADDASAVMSKVEHAVGLCNELLSGRHDLQSANDEVGVLIGLLQRLDKKERWQEALRVARCLSTLAALLERWIELLRSLQTALHAAQELGNELDQAWALHELGTLHLAAGRHAEADDLLGRARQIRERCRDHRGLAITDRNLEVLCKALRRELRQRGHKRLFKSLRRSPIAGSIAAVVLVVVGGAAGAMIGRSASSDRHPFHAATVAFTFTPRAPHKGQRVVFTATASDRKDPVASYTWRWGDGDPAGQRVQSHIYKASRTYTATLIVKDASGRVTGESSQLVVVKRPPFAGPNAAFTYEPRSPIVGKPATFDARSSFDDGSNVVDYTWDLGDGNTADGPVVSHAYGEAKSYFVTLKVTDASGRSNALSETVAVGSQPGLRPPRIALVCPPSSAPLGEAVSVSGSIAPPRPEATLTVTYTGPSGHSLTAHSPSIANGSYKASETPDVPGQWSVQSSWEGDSEYLPGTSEACPFSVNAPVVDRALAGPSKGSPSEANTEKEAQREKRESKEQVASEPPPTEPPASASGEEPPP